MGKAPDDQREDDWWKNRDSSYYMDGWLATGNIRGVVGVTLTTCYSHDSLNVPPRTNYNLRGHRAEVTIVKWNEPFQKLATCDGSGIIFVWIKHEGRWSIELMNDRSIRVTDFSWSHNGRMAVICYQDGFVLVGSAGGQRYWSSMLDVDATITCGIWSPTDQEVLFGTSNGQIVVIDVNGFRVAEVTIMGGIALTAMCWSCNKFGVETEADSTTSSPEIVRPPPICYYTPLLAASFQNGDLYLMKNYDDISPIVLRTKLKGIKMDWSSNGEVLAVAGVVSEQKGPFNVTTYTNSLFFYTETGHLRLVVPIAYNQSPVSAVTWGHEDRRVFVATGPVIHVGWVTPDAPSLQLLSAIAVYRSLRDLEAISALPLAACLKSLLDSLSTPTIKGHVPDPRQLREFVSKPPPNEVRLQCTMIRRAENDVTTTYTLFLENLGGLVPILRGRRVSKLRPEFVIYDPQAGIPEPPEEPRMEPTRPAPGTSSSESSDIDEGCASPRLPRRRKLKKNQSQQTDDVSSPFHRDPGQSELPEVESLLGPPLLELFPLDVRVIPTYVQGEKLVEITSNIWGTRFKMVGLATWLPEVLGTVSYRTSLLHLQPRQLTMVIKELRGPQPASAHRAMAADLAPTPTFSEDEDDLMDSTACIQSAPIAPMTPKKQRRSLGSSPPLMLMDPLPSCSRSRNLDYGGFLPSEEFLTLEISNERVHTIRLHPSPPSTLPKDSSKPRLKLKDSYAVNGLVQIHPHHNGSSSACGSVSSLSAGLYTSSSPPNSGQESCHSKNSFAPQCSWQSCDKPNEGGSTLTKWGSGTLVGKATSPSYSHVPRWESDLRVKKDGKFSYPGSPVTAVGNRFLFMAHRSHSIGHLNLTDAGSGGNGGATEKKSKPAFLREQRGSFKSRLHGSSDKKKENADFSGKKTSPPSSSKTSNLCNSPKTLPLLTAPHSPFSSPTASTSGFSLGAHSSHKVRLLSEEGPEIRPLPPHLQEHRGSLPDRMPLPPSGPVSRSIPSSPVAARKSAGAKSGRRGLLYSPLLLRKVLRTQFINSSDEESAFSSDDVLSDSSFKDRESFQRAFLHKKLKKRRGRLVADGGLGKEEERPPYREFILHNKAPLWNEVSQVYQLDFGGRVTQESAKNFQIEYHGRQVLQFGRIHDNAYTLDFEYPFSPLQAFAVALANVTQRLK
ncbi:TULP4 [Cordylochernes scorpioides]|uniref:TULP4 n=1 Tax=Cordylochernes scorpioides TaxID=51811 RepID=A0ABY6KV75_9ARAC|nr:TULP4 [Cordylochernes scorpioides]